MIRRGDTLNCWCDECWKTETFSIRELQYEGALTGYSRCQRCEKYVCAECRSENKCFVENGKKISHDREVLEDES